MRRTAAAVVLALGLLGCGDDTDEPSREALVDALVDNGIEPTEADCWVAEAYDVLSPEDMEAIEAGNISYDDFDDPEAVDAAGDECLGD